MKDMNENGIVDYVGDPKYNSVLGIKKIISNIILSSYGTVITNNTSQLSDGGNLEVSIGGQYEHVYNMDIHAIPPKFYPEIMFKITALNQNNETMTGFISISLNQDIIDELQRILDVIKIEKKD